MNTHLTTPELSFQLEAAGVKTVLTAEEFQDKLQEIPVQIVGLKTPRLKVKKEINYRNTATETDIASIMYTSGTTGKPKGVLQSFGNHYASALATKTSLNVTEEDCWVCTVPLFHISGLSILMRQLILGCSLRLYPHFNGVQLTEDLRNGKGTIVSVVNTTLAALIALFPQNGYSPKFKTFLLGGGPIDVNLLKECLVRNLAVTQSYGMTETCSQIVALNEKDAARKLGSSGQPLTNVSLQIMLEENTCPAGEIGEICVQGPQIMKRYLQEETENASSWNPDGWFHTGDMGYIDEEGCLYVVSRLNDLIISGGENIYPAEVEQILSEMSQISEIAVVGKKNQKWGAVPVAYIVKKSAVTSQDIQQYAKNKLAAYKIPKEIHFVEKLPKTASGKVAKHRLVAN